MRTYYTVGKVRVGDLAPGDAIMIEHDGHSEWRLVLDVWSDMAAMRRHFGENSPLVRRVDASKVLETKMYVVVRYLVEEESRAEQTDSFVIRRRVELIDVQVPVD